VSTEKAEKPVKAKVTKADAPESEASTASATEVEAVETPEAAPIAEKPAKAAAPTAKKKAAKPAASEVKAEISRIGARKIRQGIVVSNKMMKTVTVKIERRVQHPLYGKIVLRTEKFKAHDETNMCDVGDVVELMETRPLSREKRFRVTRIVEKVK
jgi:small subunit ribosomal protein S17